MAAAAADPHKWLEEVLDEKALEWVKERNADCLEAVGDPKEGEMFKRMLAILDSKEKIPSAFRIGGKEGKYLYNFWQDEQHVQGIWRKCTMESFKTPAPEWTTVIDVDALPPPTVDTAKTWVWQGSTLLDEGPGSTFDRVLIKLSPGGSDASTVREFDLAAETWLDVAAGGFSLPDPAKSQVSFRSRDELLVGSDFGGDGSCLTDSGYPRVVKSWKRGTPLEEAKTVFEVQQTDIMGTVNAFYDRGFVHELQTRVVTFYETKQFYRRLTPEKIKATACGDEAVPFVPVPVPDDSQFGIFADMGLVSLRSPWAPKGAGREYPAGSYLAAALDDIFAEDWSKATVLFEPTDAKSLEGQNETKDFMVLKVLEDVRTKLIIWKYLGNGKFELTSDGSGGSIAVGEDVSVRSIDRMADADNLLWLTRCGFLVPDTLELADAANGCTTPERYKAKPADFNATELVVEQHFVSSLDGTRIPYFICHRKDLPLDGSTPTLVDAYGGFEISDLPRYSGVVGTGWMEAGCAKVVANIRGGGEYGPKWHQAALKEKRPRAYEDLEAVAQDLIDRKITSPAKLAVIGGSNGGLMVGNMLCRPVASRSFGAAICQVPLLDMKVYSKLLAGASWMGEYGNPEVPEEWKALRTFSPYQMLRHDLLGLPEEEGTEAAKLREGAEDWVCPKVLFFTSTRDDRVHPAHARKMVAALVNETPKEKAPVVRYYENTEGGHGGAADNKQRAFMWALTYGFLKKVLEVK